MNIQLATTGFVIGSLLALAISYVGATNPVRSHPSQPGNNATTTQAMATAFADKHKASPPVSVYIDPNGAVWSRLNDVVQTKAEADRFTMHDSNGDNALDRPIRIKCRPQVPELHAKSTHS